jgi:hypothetical protein
MHFEQKFTMGSYKIGIEHIWCCQKAYENLCSSFVQDNYSLFIYLILYNLPKQQKATFRSQVILGIFAFQLFQ